MNGEMYVVKLINMSERARAIATGILGEVFKEKQLEKLRDPDVLPELASELHCSKEKVFEEFGKRIRDALDQHSLDKLTRSHLDTLRNRYFSLARLLDCSPDDVLGNLFDPEAMKRTLEEINAPPAPDASLLTLLNDILSPPNAASIERMYGGGYTDWGVIVKDEKWLKDYAIKALKRYADSQDWPSQDVTRALATYLKELESSRVLRGPERSQAFDLLGLTYLRQRLQFLVTLLRDEAIEYAKDAAESNPSQLSLSHLPAWLEIYERGAITRALPYLIPESKPLSAFFPRRNRVILPLPPGINQQPDPTKNLVIANPRRFMKVFLFELPKIVERREVGTFDVHCYLQGEADPRPVLRCHSLPLETYDHLQAVIPKLTGVDLSPVGNSIGERLPNTLVVLPNRFLRLLNVGVKDLGLTFAQCMVLCGTPLPIKMDIPGREDLKDELPYKKLDFAEEIKFPKDVQGVAQLLQDQYIRNPTRLKVVEGTQNGERST